ncbi:MAG: hypothetical protein JXA78_19815 [Anaerolineales bacterium]|nr:hypothetical protein [Anaerolineales bacterium]
MDVPCSPSVRALYAWEIQEARRVFGVGLAYERVRIHECTAWPNTINRIGARLKGMQYSGAPNAITLGNHCYFPVKLLDAPVPVEHPGHSLLPWLMHELTHAWQFQKMGWRYLGMALSAQMRYGAKAYDFGGEQGLLSAARAGKKLADFNLEQQGDIASTYYARLSRGQDVSAWQTYILQIQGQFD